MSNTSENNRSVGFLLGLGVTLLGLPVYFLLKKKNGKGSSDYVKQ